MCGACSRTALIWKLDAIKKGFYYDIKHLINDRSRGKQLILFPESLNVFRGEAEGNIEIRGKQIVLFPEGPVLK